MKARNLAIIVILLILMGVPLFSQVAEFRPTSFLVLSNPADSGADQVFQRIMNGYMKFELERAGLAVTTESQIAGELNEMAIPGVGEDIQTRMMNLGKAAEVDFVIACIYKRVDNTMRMQFFNYDVENGQIIATALRERRQALLLEWSIADVIDTFLADIEDRLVFSDDITVSAERYAEAEQYAETETKSGEPEISEQSSQNEVAMTTGSLEPAAIRRPEQPDDTSPAERSVPYRDDISKRFEFVGGMAPFVLVGRTSDYSRLGFNTTANVGYRFIYAKTQMVLALSTGICTFKAESAATSSNILLLPLAAQIALRTTSSKLGFIIHAAGGGAAFLLSPNKGGYRFKVVPYAGSGLGVEIPISNRLGLLIDLSFAVYLESSSPVLGYTPSANLYVRF